MQVFLIMRV